MCSNPEERVAALGRAIDELASQARATESRGMPARAGGPEGPEPGAASSSDVLAGSNRAGERGDSRAPDEREMSANPDRAYSPDDPAAPNRTGALDASRTAEAAASSDVLVRLAALWAELATLDPEVAKRLPTYEA